MIYQICTLSHPFEINHIVRCFTQLAAMVCIIQMWPNLYVSFSAEEDVGTKKIKKWHRQKHVTEEIQCQFFWCWNLYNYYAIWYAMQPKSGSAVCCREQLKLIPSSPTLLSCLHVERLAFLYRATGSKLTVPTAITLNWCTITSILR